MYYELEGEGFPLLLIPGMGSSLEVWAPSLRRALSKEYHLLLMDNRGTGRSSAPEKAYTVAMMAQDISELMEQTGIKRAHVMGLSLGAMIGQELALNHSEKLEKLILCATHCGVKHYIPLSKVKEEKETTDIYADSIVNLMYPPEFIKNNPEQIKDIVARETRYPIPEHIFERIYQAAREFDSFKRLGQIKVPTLVLCGDSDLMVNPENSHMLAQYIHCAKLKVFAGGGHGFIEQFPDQVLAVVRDFLA